MRPSLALFIIPSLPRSLILSFFLTLALSLRLSLSLSLFLFQPSFSLSLSQAFFFSPPLLRLVRLTESRSRAACWIINGACRRRRVGRPSPCRGSAYRSISSCARASTGARPSERAILGIGAATRHAASRRTAPRRAKSRSRSRSRTRRVERARAPPMKDNDEDEDSPLLSASVRAPGRRRWEYRRCRSSSHSLSLSLVRSLSLSVFSRSPERWRTTSMVPRARSISPQHRYDGGTPAEARGGRTPRGTGSVREREMENEIATPSIKTKLSELLCYCCSPAPSPPPPPPSSFLVAG